MSRMGGFIGGGAMPPDVEEAMAAQQRMYEIRSYRQSVAMSVAVGLATMNSKDNDRVDAKNIAMQSKAVADALAEVMFPEVPDA